MPVLDGPHHFKNSLPPVLQIQRGYFHCALRRCSKKDTASVCAPSSYTNYRFLDHAQLMERMRNTHSLLHQMSREQARLQEAFLQTKSLPLSSEESDDVRMIVLQWHCLHLLLPKDVLKGVFIVVGKNLCRVPLNYQSIRWHSLHSLSSGAYYRSSGSYETLRKSGIIQLPSGRTLRDYQHFVPSTVGRVDQQLLRLIGQTKPSPSLAKYIGLSINEIYVSWQRRIGIWQAQWHLTGFVQLDDISTYLLDYEIVEQQLPKRSLARYL